MTPSVQVAADLYTRSRRDSQDGIALAAADNLVALLARSETQRELSALALQVEFALESSDPQAVDLAVANLLSCVLPLLASPRIDADTRLAYGQIALRAWVRGER